MDYNAGYTTGGQIINVTGWGFNSQNIAATVDGTACTVLAYTDSSFECEVGIASAASTIDVPTIGQHGLRKLLINSSLALDGDYVYLNNYQDMTKPDWTRETSLGLTLEVSPNIGDRFAHEFTGWFVAPATTNYRFYMSCNDHCHVKLDTTAGSTSNPTMLTYTDQWSYFREYYRSDDLSSTRKRISDWVSLTAGEHYYIEAAGIDGNWDDSFSVAVEIEQTAIAGHQHAMKEVQEVGVSLTQNFEKLRVTVHNPDSGKYVLNF